MSDVLGRRPIYLQGDIIGSLTLLNRLQNKTRWLCKCSCGKEISRSTKYFRKKKTNASCDSCALTKRSLLSRSGFQKLVSGNRIGHLLLLDVASRQYNKGKKVRVIWRCKCACGQNCVKPAYYLSQRKETAYCGLCNLESNPSRPARTAAIFTLHEVSLRKKAFTILAGMRQAGRKCELSVDEIIALITKDCSYCGSPPSSSYNPYKNKSGKVHKDCLKVPPERIAEATVYVGEIDRIASNIDYLRSNVTPACRICNSFKSNFTLKEFEIHSVRIAKFRGYAAPEQVGLLKIQLDDLLKAREIDQRTIQIYEKYLSGLNEQESISGTVIDFKIARHGKSA